MKSLLLAVSIVLLALPASAQTPPLLASAKTVQVTETISAASPVGALQPVAVMTVKISRPGSVHLEQTRAGADTSAEPDMVLTSDGKTITEYNASHKQFRKQDAPSADRFPGVLPGLSALPPTVKPTAALLDGKHMLLFVSKQSPQVGGITVRRWTDAATGLPYRQSLFLTKNGKTIEAQRTLFSSWELDAPLDPSLFAFTPPAGATESVEPKLLANGTPAPDFTVQDRNGKDVKLSEYRGKVVVLDFWATWCKPCQESLPHTNAVARQFRGKDVIVLAVNVWDTKTAFLQWLPNHKSFDAIKFLVDPSAQGQDIASQLYNVSGIPTQYVIGKDGGIVQSFIGYDGPSSDLANAVTKAGT